MHWRGQTHVSSHRIPTPQGAGIAVIAATLMVAGRYHRLRWSSGSQHPGRWCSLPHCSFALVGIGDDIKIHSGTCRA